MPSVTIRRAGPSDAATIVRLVRELAAFEGLLDQVRITRPTSCATVSASGPVSSACSRRSTASAVAFALYFEDYSTFEGRSGIFVEDLYVAEAARGRGIGRRLLARLAQIAVERDCRRLDLCVLHWNPARGFYERLGFRHSADWLPYRLTGDALARLAGQEG